MSSPSRSAASERRSKVESRRAPLSETLPVRRAMAPSIMSNSAAGMLMSPSDEKFSDGGESGGDDCEEKSGDSCGVGVEIRHCDEGG